MPDSDSNTREIPLTQGKVATVDADDYEWLIAFKWHAAKKSGGLWYARRSVTATKGGIRKGTGERWRGTTLNMHNVIFGSSEQVDHRDGNGLNNTRKNLRAATSQQNSRNRKTNIGRKYKGVTHVGGKYLAAITVDGKTVGLGLFATPEKAARRYDAKARELFGEFARPNLR